MDVERELELQQLTRFMPIDTLLDRLSLARRYLPEPITGLLPSIVVSADGLTLVRVALTTDLYLCDVNMAGAEQASEFDLIAKDTIRNYRFRVWTQEIKEGQSVVSSYEIAQIVLVHHLGGGMTTELAYAGHDRDGWLTRVAHALPIQTILGNRQ